MKRRITPYLLVGVFVMLFASWVEAARAEAAPQVRVGLQASGTLSWVTHVIDKYNLDDVHGIDVVTTTYATKTATELALRTGDVDIVVDDFIGVTRMREQGIAVKAVYPFSLAVGSLVVPKGSPIRSIEDIKGKRIGVASLGDKSWLILRAAAIRKHGFDPQVVGSALAVAPPLMSQLLTKGELDAAMPYWHFVARMVGSRDFRVVASVTQLLESLDLPSELPILVMVAREKLIAEKPDLVERFLAAVRDAWDRMAKEQAVWDEFVDKNLYSLPDRSLLSAVREAWTESVPRSWDQSTVRSLVDLVRKLASVVGPDELGVSEIDNSAFVTNLQPRRGR